MLFKFYNPVIESMRGLQHITNLKEFKERLGIKRVSLGSLSEASTVFDAKLLQCVVEELSLKALPKETDAKLREIEEIITGFDGTLIHALPKMAWALWVDEHNRSAKLHLEYDIVNQIPTYGVITDANANEREILRKALKSGRMYLIDSGYSKYDLFQEIIDKGSSFVGRLRDNAAYKVIKEKLVNEAQRKLGIQRDLVVKLGSDSTREDIKGAVRVIEVFHKGNSTRYRKARVSSKGPFRTNEVDYTLFLVTNRLDLDSETILLLYRYRWQIEIFFRWFKCVLGFKHLMSHSQNGVSLQIYCALIASMLITLWTGRKPTRRTFELICLYFSGWVREEEFVEHIYGLKPQEAPA
jgi:hypothetical protein